MHHRETPDAAIAPATATAADRRRNGRLRQRTLLSSLGPVVDLSRSGMRVKASRRPRGTMNVIIFNGNGGPHLQLRARVVWSERRGFRNHLAGLEFVDPPQSALRELVKLGTCTLEH